ncbi:MAG: SpoIIE family protein phosphatase [Bacteroidetes bacterium]|nr:SpoIIE family protein phosphatase [Bacteroidota bacterium]
METATPKILIVDDEPDLEMLIRQKFRKEIRDRIYDFYFAGHGVDALRRLIENPDIELVLTDINMPEMDGLTLLSKIREMNNPLLYSVIVSAYGDIQNIRRAMNGGAYDFVIKPIDFNDLELTIKKALQNLDSFKQALKSRDELVTVRKELDEARELQLAMLPASIPNHPELDIAVSLRTASEVGGDYYDFSFPQDGSVNVVIGDATGHGMKAGLMVSIMKTLFVSDSEISEASVFFQSANKTIKSLNLNRMMMALCMVNYSGGSIRYINAGMPPVLLWKSGIVEEIENQFLPLGSLSSQPFSDIRFSMQKGDVLFAFSDGLPELVNPAGEPFGYNGIQELLKQVNGWSAQQIVDHFNAAIRSWNHDSELTDDITLMVMKRR